MLTRRMMETPLLEPRMVESPLVEADRASAKRRRRTRYPPLPRIMENAVYLAPHAWPPIQHARLSASKLLIIFEIFHVHAMYVTNLSCLRSLRDGRRHHDGVQ